MNLINRNKLRLPYLFMRYFAVILIMYSTPMLLSGMLELGHDLLHYLANHHHMHLHGHVHHDHHGLRDHGIAMNAPATHIENELSEELAPSLINFFLYLQHFDVVAFRATLATVAIQVYSNALTGISFPPLVPPPWWR